MYTLNKLLFFRILRFTSYTTVGLSFCVWVIQSSRYMKFLNTNNVTLSEFIHFTSFLFVDIISLILPIAITVAVAFVYHRFKESQQLTSMQALGGSPLYLLKSLLAFSFLAFSYLYFSNFFLSPYAWREFRVLERTISNNIRPPAKAGLIFTHAGISIYAQKYMSNGIFGNLSIIDNRNPEKSYVYFARRGAIQKNMLYLKKGERLELGKKTSKVSTAYFDSYRYDLSEFLNFIERATQPNEKFLGELFLSYNEYKKVGWDNLSKDAKESVAMLHQKLISPWMAFLGAFIAFLFNIMGAYKRKMSWQGTFFIIVTVLILQGVFFGIANASAKNLAFAQLNYWLVGVSLFVTMLLIFIRNRKK